ncbi:MAG: glycosyltransferase [Desulfobacterales bacterium]|nr:glycosyltransferase [Desulfobacterales bacterium]
MRAIRLNAMGYRILREAVTGFELAPSRASVRRMRETLALRRRCSSRPKSLHGSRRPTFEPQVSIVVPVYNRADEIGACIESLLEPRLPAGPARRSSWWTTGPATIPPPWSGATMSACWQCRAMPASPPPATGA